MIPIQLIGGNLMVRIAFVITALFYALSSIPLLLHVRQINEPETLPAGESTFSHAFKKLGGTFRDIKRYREFVKYTISFLIYNDGIMMLLDNAAIIAGILYGFKTSELIILIIILQVSGAAGAYLFGRVSNKRSSKQAILYALSLLLLVIALLFFVKSKGVFYIIAALAGFFLSGVQAVSRTMVSQLSPASKTAEFYGFLSVAGRTSTFIGPLVFGSVYAGFTNLYLNRGLSEAVAKSNGILWAIGSIVVFLIVGLVFLLPVRKVTLQDPIIFEVPGENLQKGL